MEATDTFTYEQIRAERDLLAVRLQGLSQGLNTVQGELSQRYKEVRELNNLHNEERERFEEQMETLQSENEGLRSDLGFEYSELLFLKLQMKSLEVDVENIADEEPEGADVTVEDIRRARAKREKKNRILSELDRWRTDWQDISARFKRRRNRYGVPTSPIVEAEHAGPRVEWHVEAVREIRGHTTTLTVKRIEGPPIGGLANLNGEVDHLEARFVTGSGTTFKAYVERGCQTDLSAADYMFDDRNKDEEDLDDFFSEPEDDVEEPEVPSCASIAAPTVDATLVGLPQEDDMMDDSEGESDEDLIEDLDEEDEEQDEEDERENHEELHHQPTERPGVAPPPHTHLPTNSTRSAWQELWASLASLSGLPDDEEDDF
jgi:hypothetical protein